MSVKLAQTSLFDPDIYICRRIPVLKREYQPTQNALLVIEVADTSLRRDRDVKAVDYAAAGLPELWIVDLGARVTIVMRQHGAGGFGPSRSIRFEDALSPLFAPALSVTIADLE